MLCAPLDWQYAELPSSASDAVLCSFVRCGTSNQIEQEADSSKKFETSSENYNFIFLPASRYFVAILNIALRNWNTYYT